MVVTHCVILAAGRGSRLRSVAPCKPLVPVGGQTLLRRAIGQAIAAGCEQVVVVAGHGHDAIVADLEASPPGIATQVITNLRHDQPNGVSLAAAEPFVEDPFFVLMADHVFSRPILRDLLAAGTREIDTTRLLVDADPHWCEEGDATKVLIRGGRPVGIGKELQEWTHIDTGAFLMSSNVFDALRRVGARRPPSVTDAMADLIGRGSFQTLQIERARWVDVDTPDDHDAAAALCGC